MQHHLKQESTSIESAFLYLNSRAEALISFVVSSVVAVFRFLGVQFLFASLLVPVADFATAWIKTIPGKGWFSYFRIYGPEKEAFDGSWKPGDFEEVK